MITRIQLVTVLSLLTVFFIVFQIYLVQKIPRLPERHGRQLSRYDVIKHFLGHCEESRIHCIVADLTVLRALAVKPLEESKLCRHLCQNRTYTFAIGGLDYQVLETVVLPAMKASGLNIRVTFSERIRSDIPTHVHLCNHEQIIIHIVILHRKNTWWWYGADFNPDLNLDFTRNEGVLDEFDYHKAKLDGIDVFTPEQPKEFMKAYNNSKFLPCNGTRALLFHKQYQKDTSAKAIEFRNVAVNAIRLIKTHLDVLGIPFWLSSGTLLGWFRQCDIIPYSVDVDIGVFIKDHTLDMLEKLQASSLTLEHKFGKVEDSLQYAFFMDKVKLDIFFFYEDEASGKMWNGGTDYNNGDKFKYLFDSFKLCWTEFYDMKLRVPCDTEEYIKANYGDNWFTPVKNWDWSKSPPNVVPNGEWEDDELDDAIQLWDRKGKRIALEWTREEA